MTSWLADTSVAVPFVHAAHSAHRRVQESVGNRVLGLPAHAAVETYSVLTRLPGDARLTPSDASALIQACFDRIAVLDDSSQDAMVGTLATANVAGGAVYDAVIALTARRDGSALLTRDARAASTYAALGIPFEVLV